LKSGDGGQTWKTSNDGLPQHKRIFALALHPKSPRTLYAATSEGLFKSSDGGASWSAAGGLTKEFFQSVAVSADGTVVAGTNGEDIFRSGDGGATFEAAKTDVNLSGDRIYAMAADRAFDPAGSRTLLAGTKKGIFRSTDGARSWSHVSKSAFDDEIQQIAFALSDGKRVYARDKDTVFRSDDAGATWSQMRPDLEVQSSLLGAFALASGTASADVVLASTYRKLFRSSDGAKTWAETAGIPATARVQAIVPDPSAKVLWAATEGEGIYRSSDGGATWTVAGKGTENANVQALLVDSGSPGTVYAATWMKGILRTTDGGKTWTPIGSAPPHPDAVALALERGPSASLLVGFGGGSVWRLDLETAGRLVPAKPAPKKR
jgi:photosystem II stability/assembly factor-like uncharacterized protein